MIIVRPPVVAGVFYNLNPEMLKKQIESCLKHKFGPNEIKRKDFISAIVPHAGYEYSGPTAAWVYSRIIKKNYIIIGPNHQGAGSNFAIMKVGLWKTPLNGIVIDEEMAQKLMSNCKLLEHDILAHEAEHSIEVQLPFLQYRFGNDFKFIPISVMNDFADEDLLENCRIVGNAIANTIKNKDWIILASSDFSHYIPQNLAEKTDKYLIKAILKMDEKEFFNRVNEKNASVCGFGPIAIAIVTAKKLGAKRGELLSYRTSGDITSEYSSVVGYASIIFY